MEQITTFLSLPRNWFVIVGTMALQVSSGFCQNATSSRQIKSAVQPLQDSGFPGRDIILEPLLKVIQVEFEVYVIFPLDSTFTASANFKQVFNASFAALNPVERYRTREFGFLQQVYVERNPQHQLLPIYRAKFSTLTFDGSVMTRFW